MRKMRGKRLLPLAALLIMLIVAVVLFKRQPAPPSLTEEVGFERLVPQSLSAAAINGIDLYQGEKAENAVRLRRQDQTWVVTSYYNAPAKADKISKFLDTLGTLAGEVRSDKAELLGDFRLTDAQALHVLLYTTDADTPAVHLLAGKSSGRNGFMRVADSPRVYSVNLNVQSEAGLQGTDTAQAPEAKPWLHLQLQDIPKDQVSAIELHMPTRHVLFALEKPPTSAKEADQAATSEPKTDTPTPPTSSPTPKSQWKLVSPNVPFAVKQGAVESLVSTLTTLRGDDIVSPEKVAEYGLDTPAYRATLTLQAEGQEARQVSVWVGHEVPEQAGKHYARVGQDGPIYILPAWVMNQIFPHLGTLLTIEIFHVSSQDVAQFTWQQDGQSWTLARQASTSQATAGTNTPASTWHFVDHAEASVDAQAVTSMLDIATKLTAEDWFADPPDDAGLAQPALSITLELQDGQSHQVAFGNATGKEGNRYVSRPNSSGVFLLAASIYTSLTQDLDKLRPSAPTSASSKEKSP
jgi:hypothetical protein